MLAFILNKYIAAFRLNGNKNFYTVLGYLDSIGFSLRNFRPALGAGVSRSMSGAVSLEERELSLNQQSDRFESLGI